MDACDGDGCTEYPLQHLNSGVIRFDWSISHTGPSSETHTRHLSAVLEPNAAHAWQRSGVAVQASFWFLATVMSVVTMASIASCWGWFRRGKRKQLQAHVEAVGESNADLSLPLQPLAGNTCEQFPRPPNQQYFHLQPHSMEWSNPTAASSAQSTPQNTGKIQVLQGSKGKSSSKLRGEGGESANPAEDAGISAQARSSVHTRPQSSQAAGPSGGIIAGPGVDVAPSIFVPDAPVATESSDSGVEAQETSMMGAAPTFALMARTASQGQSAAVNSSLDNSSRLIAGADSFPGLMPQFSRREQFDAPDDMSDIGEEEEELMQVDESVQLQPPGVVLPRWAGGAARSQAGDSGIAALSRPSSNAGGTPASSPRLGPYVGLEGRLKSVLDATTRLITDTGQHRIRDLHKQLEKAGNDNQAMQLFEMVGSSNLRVGAKSVVQFGRGVYDGYEYVVRFFACTDDYHAAKELYQHFPLADMLPKMLRYCDNVEGAQAAKRGCSPPRVSAPDDKASSKSLSGGERLPACIAMEKGESLVDYLDQVKGTSMVEEQQFGLRILLDVITAVVKLHDHGYVHGNIHPGHILWLPRETAWTLIGMANATRAGKLLHLQSGAGLLLSYASPELAVAMRSNQEMYAMRGFVSAGQTGAMASDCGRESCPSGGISFPQVAHASPTHVESGLVDGALTEELSVADGVEVVAGVEMDVWAVGMLAWELLTGAPAFDLEEDDEEDVMEELCGRAPLPWSGERISPEQRTKLGFFCEPVRRLLSRDASDRMSLSDFQALCHRVLFASTTIEEPSSKIYEPSEFYTALPTNCACSR